MSAERGKADGVRAFLLHPGTIMDTGLAVHVPSEELWPTGIIDENGKPIRNVARNLKTVEQGASTGIWCATSPPLDAMGGVYCEKRASPFWSPLTPQPAGNSEIRCCTSAYALCRRSEIGRTPLGTE